MSRKLETNINNISPPPSFASSLTSLADRAVSDEGSDRQYRRLLADFVTRVERFIKPKGIQFPSGNIQLDAFNPTRDEDEAIFLSFMS